MQKTCLTLTLWLLQACLHLPPGAATPTQVHDQTSIQRVAQNQATVSMESGRAVQEAYDLWHHQVALLAMLSIGTPDNTQTYTIEGRPIHLTPEDAGMLRLADTEFARVVRAAGGTLCAFPGIQAFYLFIGMPRQDDLTRGLVCRMANGWLIRPMLPEHGTLYPSGQASYPPSSPSTNLQTPHPTARDL